VGPVAAPGGLVTAVFVGHRHAVLDAPAPRSLPRGFDTRGGAPFGGPVHDQLPGGADPGRQRGRPAEFQRRAGRFRRTALGHHGSC